MRSRAPIDKGLAVSLYFSVTTLTTVGVGDLAPTTDGGKVFTIIYLMVGLGVLVALATAMGSSFWSSLGRPTGTVRIAAPAGRESSVQLRSPLGFSDAPRP